MKTYLNEQLGFKIDIPDQWSFEPGYQSHPAPGKNHSFIFRCRSGEAFNIQVKPLTLEPELNQIEDEFKSFAQERGYTSLGLGRLVVAGKEHVWARYYMGYGHWSKKYIFILNNIEYSFTAACLDEKSLLEMEQAWDQTVNSFRLLMSVNKITQPKSEKSEQKIGIAAKQVSESENMESQAPVKSKPAGTKTYLNEKHGFEIDIPEAWAPAPELPPGMMDALAGPIPPGLNKDCFQYGCHEEAMNFEIAPLYPEPLLDDTVIEFKVYAQVQGFTDLHFGRINVADKEHVCAHYFINDNMGPRWNKKYMLVFGGIEYALTVTCNNPQWFAKREKDWDAIIQSFHVLAAVDDSANATAKADRDRQERRKIVQERVEMLQDPWKMYAKACQFMAVGQYLDARMLLVEYLRDRPDHIQAHKDLAAILQKIGDTTGAIQHLREVERLDPSDATNRSTLAKLVADNPLKKTVSETSAGRLYPTPENSSHSSNNVYGVEDKSKQDYTLAFSLRSYLIIAIFSYLYITSWGVGFKDLIFLTSAAHQPLSTSEFNMLEVVLYFGIGAFICLMFLIGVELNTDNSNNASTFFGFVERTMRSHNKEQKAFGDILFSDYTKKPAGVLDALRLQVMNLIHALFKIIVIFISIGTLHFAVSFAIVMLLVGPQLIFHHPQPILWLASTDALWFFLCYRAMLLGLARKNGITREGDTAHAYRAIISPSLDSSIQSAMTKGVTPDLIAKVIGQVSVINAIRNDLLKTDQIGYKEVWRLGLITPDQDWFDPRPDPGSLQERTKRYFSDANYRYKWMEQIPIKRSAVLHSTSYFNTQFNNVLITNGKTTQLHYHLANYHLHTVLNKGEYIRIRNIQIDTNRSHAENRSQSLTKFLREDGFPLKEFYSDGDPLSADRGGIIVIDKGKLLITHPRYFVQKRLIDDEGNLVDVGIDENFYLGGRVEVKMQPAVLNSLVQYVTSNRYKPILRYHYTPYASDFMFPILDTPTSTSGWADLYIDTRGKAKLFITKEKTLAEWYEMMNELRQLFYDALAKKEYHFLGLTKDKVYLNQYLSAKMEILKKYYIIQDWQLF